MTAVNGVSFDVGPGTVLALLGPNGAGKTSTVETLEGYRVAHRGHVRVLGLDPQADAKALAPRIGVMLQRNGVYLSMGPREVVRLFAAYYGTRATDPDELVTRVGLDDVASTPWRRLSGGEQQRLSLALALVGRPEVAFLDEPTANIDPSARILVREIIRDLRDRGTCVLLTTHDLDEAQKLADRIVILDHGVVVAEGTPADLLAATADDDIHFSGPPAIAVDALSQRMNGIVVVERAPGEYRVATAPTPHAIAALTAWMAEQNLTIGDLRAGRQSLEDVFLRLTKSTETVTANPADNTADERPAAGGRRRPGRRR